MNNNLRNIIFNYKTWLHNCETQALYLQLTECLNLSGFTILQTNQHHFTPQGYTAIWLLAESHLALHTFPENKVSYLELSSCNEQKRNTFEAQINKRFIVSPYEV